MGDNGGNYVEIAGGAINEDCKEDYTMFAQNMNFNALRSANFIGNNKGLSYCKPKDAPVVEKKQGKVKEIELVTTLDFGSKNDKSGGTQLGMIFGKEYTFQVKQYENETPLSKQLTKWQLRYHSPKYSKNKWIDIPLKVTGNIVKITMNEEDMCGRFVYIQAYIDDPKSEGELKVWKHNRFRWFDRMIVEKGFEDRKNDPTLIDQHRTSLCGTAAILFVYAKENGSEYLKKYFEFFRTGYAKINNYSIKPNPKIFDFNPINTNLDYPAYRVYSNGQPIVPPHLMEQADWISLVGTRSSDNKKYLGKDGEDWDAINWPEYMETMAVSFYRASLLENKLRTITGLNFTSDLIEMQKEYQNGWKIIMLIDSDMLDDSISYLGCVTNYHWISYEGDLYIDTNKQAYEFSYYCWKKLYKKKSFRTQVFNTNFYGYIKFKK
ncbi:hypothetical protein BWK58_15180 [Flavobacterium columnare]|nr:hypothetical protein BWK58_15180 [Flavobacterium columnare]